MKNWWESVIWLALAGAIVGVASRPTPLAAQGVRVPEASQGVRIVSIEGQVQVKPAGASRWFGTSETNQLLTAGDRLMTGRNARVLLLEPDQVATLVGPATEVEVLAPESPAAETGLHLLRGLLSFFHRGRPSRIRIQAGDCMAGINGTEFVVSVTGERGQEQVTFSVIDGSVSLTNRAGSSTVTNGQQVVVEAGKKPEPARGFIANNVLQWCFYYPAVLDPADLPLSAKEQEGLEESLAAYRAGDLLQALGCYPPGRQPASPAETVYWAALLLAVGEVEPSEAMLAGLPAGQTEENTLRCAEALRVLVAAVKRQTRAARFQPQLASELMAASYYEQSQALGEVSLRRALELARQAAARAPQLGYAWERVAELEFGFRETARAQEALARSLELSPRNAQGLALKGFLLAA